MPMDTDLCGKRWGHMVSWIMALKGFKCPISGIFT